MRIKSLMACLCALTLVACGPDGIELSPEEVLAISCSEGDFDAVLQSLEEGADANGGLDSPGLPLLAALSEGYFTIADILVDNGAEVNVFLYDEMSLLDTFINESSQTDSQVEEAKFQLAIDWLYENGAQRPPE